MHKSTQTDRHCDKRFLGSSGLGKAQTQIPGKCTTLHCSQRSQLWRRFWVFFSL